MKNNRCSNCYFGDKCRSLYACEYYSPVGELTDEDVDEIIEVGHQEFLDEWNHYIEEYSDYFFDLSC